MVLGTVGYMSPEQVRGEAVDHRSDIFSLGCVLYEMLAGERAFARPTVAETLAAIVAAPVPDPSVSGSDAPPDLTRVVQRCLEKQPGERFQSAHDLAFALRSMLAGSAMPPGLQPSTAASPGAGSSSRAAPVHDRRPWLRVTGIGVTAVAVVLALGGTAGVRRRQPRRFRPPRSTRRNSP